MFARVAAFALALPLLAAATSNCNTGPIQCCNSLQNTDSPVGAAMLGVLGVALQGITGNIGLGCSPISVVGAGPSSCSASPVCCQNNNVGGAVSIGCLPIEL